jgi:hypothetical protein
MSGDKEKLDKFDIEKHIMMHRVAEMELRTRGGVWFFPRLLNFSLAQPAASTPQPGGTQQLMAV